MSMIHRIPSSETVGLKDDYNGPICYTPDGNPLLGPIRGLPGYWSACAVMAGLSQGGGVGLALANIGAGLSGAFVALVRRDLLLAFRRRTELLFPVIFLLVVISLFPLGIGPGPQLLARIAPGVIWIAALLATVISLDGLFRSDFEDGTLEQFVISGHPLTLIALAKILTHWLVAGLPIVLLSPLLAVWMNLPTETLGVMIATLLLGTPVLSLIGAVGGFGVEVEGNILTVLTAAGEELPLNVAEACSGMRSIMGLLALGVAFGYFWESPLWERIFLIVSTVPIAMIAAYASSASKNFLRVKKYSARRNCTSALESVDEMPTTQTFPLASGSLTL